ILTGQKAVLAFQAGHGPDAVAHLDADGNLGQLRRRLDRAGVPFRTLVPRPGGFRVVVFDEARRLRPSLNPLPDEFGTPLHLVAGTGRMLGGSTRPAARDSFQRHIHRYEETSRRRYRPAGSGLPNHLRAPSVSTLWGKPRSTPEGKP